MGIGIHYFDDQNHSLFLCKKCEDVAKEPTVTMCCEDCYCSSCFETVLQENGGDCDNCHSSYPEPKTKKLQRQLATIYSNLRLKCDESSCSEVLNIQNFADHVKSCPKKPFDCEKCGMEGKLPDKDTHDCLEWLKLENRRLASENKTLRDEVRKLKNEQQDNEIEIDALKSRLRASEAKSKNRGRSSSRARNGGCDGNCGAAVHEAMDQVRTVNRRLKESYAQREALEKQLYEASNGFERNPFDSGSGRNGYGDGLNTVTNEMKKMLGVTSSRIMFDPVKTSADDDIKDCLTDAIAFAESKGKVDRQKYDFVNRDMAKKIGGVWISMDAYEFNPAKANMAPKTFCYYTYEGTKHVTFQKRKF